MTSTSLSVVISHVPAGTLTLDDHGALSRR